VSDSSALGAPNWTDSHCHLHDEEDPDVLLDRARAAGVERLILVGTGAASSMRAVELARSGGHGVFATIGLHPHDASAGIDSLADCIDALVPAVSPHAAGEIVGIGECGLDYFYEHSPREAQRDAFAAQIALAKRLNLTLVVHTRDAWSDTFDILEGEGLPERTVIHCFTGGVDEARRCLDLGCYLSFSGIVTFKNAHDLRDAAVLAPADRVLVETDAPYLAPVPHRGQRNEPAWVAFVGSALAELRDVPVAEFAAQTSANTTRAFQLADA
jgi:TatD DNase family protein